jgi:hypothetical protein
MIQRDSQGRQVFVMEETADALGMTITNGMTYRFHGGDYLATLEDQSSDTVACFLNQVDDEPSLFLDREGGLMDDTGANVGSYDELEAVEN